MKKQFKLFLSVLFVSTLSILIISAFKIETKPPAQNACSATSILGASCTADCPVGQTPSCKSGIVTVSCTCNPSEDKGTLSLNPSNKYDEIITASLGFGTFGGNSFARTLSQNKADAIAGNWSNFESTAISAENIYNNVLSSGERTIIDGLLY